MTLQSEYNLRHTLTAYRWPKRAAGQEGDMGINRDILRCVMFLCVERNIEHARKHVPVATAFLVRVQDDIDPSIDWAYVVTARHIIEDADSDQIYIRVNLVKGNYVEFPTNRDDWVTHDTADVALIGFDPPREQRKELDCITIPLDMFVGGDYRYYGHPLPKDGSIFLPVTIGDEILFAGLFTEHTGSGRNLPIIRFGNISAMPEEPISLPRWHGSSTFEALAYLAECRSWGGHSGSPTFWKYPASVKRSFADKEIWEMSNVIAFLGLVSAHFDIPKEARVTGDVLGKIETEVNAGIAVITPSEAIRQLLMRQDLMKDRQEQKKRIQSQRPMATLDVIQLNGEGVTREISK